MLIQEMIEGQIKKTTTATVAVGNVNDNKDSIERQKRNNTALELMSGCERKAFLKHLIKLWMDVRTLGWSDKEKMESLIYLFGEAYGKRSPFGEQLIYTVTMSGNIYYVHGTATSPLVLVAVMKVAMVMAYSF